MQGVLSDKNKENLGRLKEYSLAKGY